jgi:hypothetical protein
LVGFVVPAESSHNEKTCVYACLHVRLRRGNLFSRLDALFLSPEAMNLYMCVFLRVCMCACAEAICFRTWMHCSRRQCR